MRVRPAFAIAAALCALVIIAVLVTGAFFASAQETSATRLDILDQQAFSVAELGAARAVSGWNGQTMESAAQGSATALGTFGAPPLESSVTATKLDSGLFVVVSEGRVTSPDAQGIHRTVAILVRMERADSGRFITRRVTEQAWTEAY
ncbi:MAG TPA: hypothetical protein VIF83_04825 [Gemmatimonadaceae bacterium]|jgi:hypothetical protein